MYTFVDLFKIKQLVDFDNLEPLVIAHAHNETKWRILYWLHVQFGEFANINPLLAVQYACTCIVFP